MLGSGAFLLAGILCANLLLAAAFQAVERVLTGWCEEEAPAPEAPEAAEEVPPPAEGPAVEQVLVDAQEYGQLLKQVERLKRSRDGVIVSKSTIERGLQRSKALLDAKIVEKGVLATEFSDLARSAYEQERENELMKSEIVALRAQAHESGLDADDNRHAVRRLEAQVVVLDDWVAKTQKDTRTYRDRAAQAEWEAHYLRLALKRCKDKVANHESTISLHRNDMRSADATINSTRKELQELQNRAETLQATVFEYRDENDRLKGAVESRDHELQTIRESLHALQQQLDTTKSNNISYHTKRDLDHRAELEDVTSQLNTWKSDNARLRKKVNKLRIPRNVNEAVLAQSSSEVSALQKEWNAMDEHLARKEEELYAKTEEMQQQEEERLGTQQAQLSKVEADLAQALKDSQKAQAERRDMERQFNEAVEDMKKAQNAQSSVECGKSQLEKDLAQAAKEIADLKQAQKSFDHEKVQMSNMLEQLQAQVEDAQAAQRDAERSKNDLAHQLAQQQQVMVENMNLKQAQKSFADEKDQMSRIVEQLRSQVQEAQTAQHDSESSKNALEHQLAQQQQAMAENMDLKQAQKSFAVEKDQMSRMVEQLRSQVQEAQAAQRDAEESRDSLQRYIAEQEQRVIDTLGPMLGGEEQNNQIPQQETHDFGDHFDGAIGDASDLSFMQPLEIDFTLPETSSEMPLPLTHAYGPDTIPTNDPVTDHTGGNNRAISQNVFSFDNPFHSTQENNQTSSQTASDIGNLFNGASESNLSSSFQQHQIPRTAFTFTAPGPERTAYTGTIDPALANVGPREMRFGTFQQEQGPYHFAPDSRRPAAELPPQQHTTEEYDFALDPTLMTIPATTRYGTPPPSDGPYYHAPAGYHHLADGSLLPRQDQTDYGLTQGAFGVPDSAETAQGDSIDYEAPSQKSTHK